MDRFLFPDSPTSAWFLTEEERVMAVQRIKVNQAGIENKVWKQEQWVSFSSSLRFSPFGSPASQVHRNPERSQDMALLLVRCDF